ncbi:MAG: hypothetical protein ACI8ZM_001894 [Crocinitomix sp.]|jgi:hypothetical protein
MELFSLIIVLFLTFFCLWQISGKLPVSKRTLLVGWGIKLGFSIAFILVFSQYYGNDQLYGDAYNFMNDSRILCEFGSTNPLEYIKLLIGIADESALFEQTILSETNIWSYGENGDFINDNRLIIRINSMLHFISFGNIYTHAILLSFLAYLGILLLYKTFVKHMANPQLSFYLLLAFPSIVFWSSGITKESLLVLSLGLFFYGLFHLFQRRSLLNFIILTAGVFMLLFNKPHVGLIILALSPLFIIGALTQWKVRILWIFPIVITVATIALTYAPTQVNLLDKVSYKQKDLINMGKGGIFFVTDSSFCAFAYEHLNNFESKADKKITVLNETEGEYKLFGQHPFHPFTIASDGQKQYDVYLIQPPSLSYIPITPINYNRTTLLTSIPEVLQNTIIRPYPWDPGSTLKYFPFASNLLLIGLIIFVFINRKRTSGKEKHLLSFFVISAFLILLLIGWTTPILGAIVRYKIAAELLLIIALCILLKPLKNEV